MLKYIDSKVVFNEVPDEITLAINISGCPIGCPDCHSKYLWKDEGKELTIKELEKLIDDNWGITCISFMGGDNDPEEVAKLAEFVKDKYERRIKTAWYSGNNGFYPTISIRNFDFIKFGPFIKERGPITNKNTNQVMYEIMHIFDGNNYYDKISNITYKFWKKD